MGWFYFALKCRCGNHQFLKITLGKLNIFLAALVKQRVSNVFPSQESAEWFCSPISVRYKRSFKARSPGSRPLQPACCRFKATSVWPKFLDEFSEIRHRTLLGERLGVGDCFMKASLLVICNISSSPKAFQNGSVPCLIGLHRTEEKASFLLYMQLFTRQLQFLP